MFKYLGNKIERPGDLAPLGVAKSTGTREPSMRDFNKTFTHIFRQIKKIR